jgi:hypothetical protein
MVPGRSEADGLFHHPLIDLCDRTVLLSYA